MVVIEQRRGMLRDPFYRFPLCCKTKGRLQWKQGGLAGSYCRGRMAWARLVAMEVRRHCLRCSQLLDKNHGILLVHWMRMWEKRGVKVNSKIFVLICWNDGMPLTKTGRYWSTTTGLGDGRNWGPRLFMYYLSDVYLTCRKRYLIGNQICESAVCGRDQNWKDTATFWMCSESLLETIPQSLL